MNIDTMLSTHGFFYYPIENMELVNKMMNSVKEYFILPLNKKKLQPHNKEGLGYIPCNRIRGGKTITKESFTFIPNKIVSYDDNTFNDYYNMVQKIARKIFTEIMNSIMIDQNKYNDIINMATSTMSILHYPKITMNNNMVGISPHTDWGLITILYTEVGGLQVNINNKWHNVPPKKDHFIINIADMVEILTGGIYKSTLHRVINTDEKYSIAMFYEPNKKAIIKPITKINGSNYKTIKYEDYHGDKIKISTNKVY